MNQQNSLTVSRDFSAGCSNCTVVKLVENHLESQLQLINICGSVITFEQEVGYSSKIKPLINILLIFFFLAIVRVDLEFRLLVSV